MRTAAGMTGRARSRLYVTLGVLAAIALLAAAVAWTLAPGFADGLSGSRLEAERVSGSPPALALDAALVREEMPELAALLDEASRDGRARMSGDASVNAVFAYLDEKARAAGATAFQADPFNGVVSWEGGSVSLNRLQDG